MVSRDSNKGEITGGGPFLTERLRAYVPYPVLLILTSAYYSLVSSFVRAKLSTPLSCFVDMRSPFCMLNIRRVLDEQATSRFLPGRNRVLKMKSLSLSIISIGVTVY